MRKSACFCIVTATYYWMLIMLGIVLMALYALFHLIFITPWSKYYYHLHLQIMKLRVRKFNSPDVLWLVRGELDLTPGEISCALHHAVLHSLLSLFQFRNDWVPSRCQALCSRWVLQGWNRCILSLDSQFISWLLMLIEEEKICSLISERPTVQVQAHFQSFIHPTNKNYTIRRMDK